MMNVVPIYSYMALFNVDTKSPLESSTGRSKRAKVSRSDHDWFLRRRGRVGLKSLKIFHFWLARPLLVQWVCCRVRP